MSWQAYKLRFRLCSPLHIGRGKVGNLQLTRSYVTGRNLWGALTARLTRNSHPAGKPAPQTYVDVGERVNRELAFTYLFATTNTDGSIETWPWEENFRYHYLSTYASTALDYSAASAEENSLHEVEYLMPHTREAGKQVYLTGYLFQRADSALEWQSALARLQVGGERGYGWGQLELVSDPQPLTAKQLFAKYSVTLPGERPQLRLTAEQRFLAHTLASNFEDSQAIPTAAASITGSLEPLVGRETKRASKFGQQPSPARICYVPGAFSQNELKVQIGPYGIWGGTDAPPT